MLKVGIAGASGYAGAELIRLLAAHPEAQITYLASESCAGKHVSAAFPSFDGQELPICEAFDPAKAVESCELLFFANSGYSSHAPWIMEKGVKIIAVPGDFRFADGDVYQKWYGKPHPAPAVAYKAVYGVTELHKEEISKATLIANPGCYAVASILALAPLVKNDLVQTGTVLVDAKSGVSGAGRTKVEQSFLFTEVNENVRAYRLGNHQHTPEIEQEINRLSGKDHIINFTPHLIPMTRGILSTCYGTLKSQMTSEELLAVYNDFYKHTTFVKVLPKGQYPATKNTLGSNFCHIGLEVDPRTNRAIVISAIDNLGKGAAGQAIQNMNVMSGLEEAVGLMNPPVYP